MVPEQYNTHPAIHVDGQQTLSKQASKQAIWMGVPGLWRLVVEQNVGLRNLVCSSATCLQGHDVKSKNGSP